MSWSPHSPDVSRRHLLDTSLHRARISPWKISLWSCGRHLGLAQHYPGRNSEPVVLLAALPLPQPRDQSTSSIWEGCTEAPLCQTQISEACCWPLGCGSSASAKGMCIWTSRALCLSIHDILKHFGGIKVISKGLTCMLVSVIYSLTPVSPSFTNKENAFECLELWVS